MREHPRNKDLLQLAILIHLNEGDTKEAARLTERLEEETGEDKTVREFKAEIFLREGKLRKALRMIDRLMVDDPANRNYPRDRASILAELGRWQEAEAAYAALIVDGKTRNEMVWEYRAAAEEGSNAVRTGYDYVHAPESQRAYTITQDVTAWVLPRFRLTARGFEEIHTKRPLGATSGINRILPGHMLKGEVFLYGAGVLSADWQTVYMGGEDFHEFGCDLKIKKGDLNSSLGGTVNRLMRDPIDGLTQRGRVHRLRTQSDILFWDRVRLGDGFETEWYFTGDKENNVDNEEYLGFKVFNDAFIDLIILTRPYLSFNFHYRTGHWNKSFDGADQVLDFIADEGILYGGFYLEHRIGDMLELRGSFTRSYDHMRRFYSTLSNAAVDLWLRDDLRITFSYEFDYEVQGTVGSGDVQIIRIETKVLF